MNKQEIKEQLRGETYQLINNRTRGKLTPFERRKLRDLINEIYEKYTYLKADKEDEKD